MGYVQLVWVFQGALAGTEIERAVKEYMKYIVVLEVE